MDILNKTTFCSSPRLYLPNREFLLPSKAGLWPESFPIFSAIIGAVCVLVLLILKEMHVV
jgi:hypothetical protein